ncbi:helix-turn-helix domain-containing protein [Streptomyces mirabilis]|uniref:helix-turn-helix domain-containing protein n=1 Tax=Streptomyces mirabilis TaxID=68239 RepID=UPI0036788192
MAAPRKRTRTARLNQEPEAIAFARQRAGLSQGQLAQMIGVSRQMMSDLELGWRSATPERLLAIAKALNCPLVFLERKRDVGTPSGEAA